MHFISRMAMGIGLTAGLSVAATIINIGPANSIDTEAEGINQKGQVTGYFTRPDGSHEAFIYTAGTFQGLGTAGAPQSEGTAINDSGEVTGRIRTTSYEHAFLYTSSSLIDLGTLGGANSLGYGLNNNGLVVGLSQDTQGTFQSFVYSESQGLLEQFASTVNMYAINDANWLAGDSHTTFARVATIYAFGRQQLGTLPGGNYSLAVAINKNGEIAGASQFSNATTDYEAVTGTIGGGLVPLGTLDGVSSFAHALNNLGDVVGFSGNAPFYYHNGTMANLNSYLPANSGWQLFDATGINDKGQIVGYGLYNGNVAAYLLDVNAPEPGTWSLLVLGGVGLLWIRRKRLLIL